MRLSRGWPGLALFWAAIAALGGVGAGILQMIGPPAPIDNSAQEERADRIFVEFASRVPVAVSAAALAAAIETPSDVDQASESLAREVSPEPVMMVARETTSSTDPAATPFDAWTVIPYRRMPIAINRGHETSAATRQEAPLPEKTLLLRITRDQKLCPRTICYKWHLVTQRAKLPRGATIDLAQLRLAPSLREATENGHVELIINATEHHKATSGHENVIFVATSLYGVTPHDETP
jgi:hypothetical protein